jgi:hypothetical protein
MSKIDKIAEYNNGVWGTEFLNNQAWSISPSQLFGDVKAQKINMIRIKINDLIEILNQLVEKDTTKSKMKNIDKPTTSSVEKGK